MFLTARDYYCLGLVILLSLTMTAAWPMGGVSVAGVAVLIALGRWWSRGSRGSHSGRFVQWAMGVPPAPVWGIAALLALLASGYFYLRLPQPTFNDLSRAIPRLAASNNPTVQVVGRIAESPLLNRSGKWRFFLEAEQYQPVGNPTPLRVSGQVYTTLPPQPKNSPDNRPAVNQSVAKGCAHLSPGQRVQITGLLYAPKDAGQGQFYQAFNFRKLLASQGSFSGLAGQSCKLLNPQASWGVWALRQRIAEAQFQFLGSNAGPVLSGMVLGNRAVQVPFAISDQFRRVGLSHALAASGFQVSLILATVLALAKGRPKQQQLLCGGLALLAFGGLSGFAPSVLRAVLMGLAGLLAMVKESKIRPLPVLLAIALVMLLMNPLWVEDLGFQFSFLATLGLMVSATPIANRLDWLPPRIADLLAVPLAATLWVLPLQLAKFGIFPLYGLLVNVLVAPLLMVITIGGFVSGLAALLWPFLGSVIAWLLTYPLMLLLGLVSWFSQLPGSSVAVGAISLAQVLVLYGLLIGLWLWSDHQQTPTGRNPWQWLAWAGFMLVLIPFWQAQVSNQRVTVLDNARLPMLVAQEPGANIVINSGAATTAQGTSTFLATQGLNQIDWAIATNRSGRAQSGWLTLAKEVTIRRFSQVATANSDSGNSTLLAQLPQSIQQIPLPVGEPFRLGKNQMRLLRAEPLALEMQLAGKRWLLLQDTKGNAGHEIWLASHPLDSPQVLWWVGKNMPPALLQQLQPDVVILSSTPTNPELRKLLQNPKIQFFTTDRDGAVQWDGQQFIANLDGEEG
jgi:competence protein ComEC